MSSLNLYSLVTIFLLFVGGIASLAFWYWIGRRPLKQPALSGQPTMEKPYFKL